MHLGHLHLRRLLPINRTIPSRNVAETLAKSRLLQFPLALPKQPAIGGNFPGAAIEPLNLVGNFKSIPVISADFVPAINVNTHPMATVWKSGHPGEFPMVLSCRIFGGSSPLFFPLTAFRMMLQWGISLSIFAMKPLPLALLGYLHRHAPHRFSAATLRLVFLQQGYRFYRLELGQILDELCQSGQLMGNLSSSGETIYELNGSHLVPAVTPPKGEDQFQMGYLGGLYE